ncbi:MAG TPA: hypothetical protein VJN22_00815 [Candidatus Eremiobacteraceae bacterium]|nr:hypothetical protein [Candidatus Eremiobacteraceae bacterium]
MLLELHRPAEARAAFAKSLHDYPNRLKSLSGAAEAATATGDRVAALSYYRMLADSCPRADSDNQEVAQARAALKARH